MTETPNLDKYIQTSESEGGEVLAAFLSWVVDHEDYALCEWNPIIEDYVPLSEGFMEDVMAEFFGIDLLAVSAEREKIYEQLKKGSL